MLLKQHNYWEDIYALVPLKAKLMRRQTSYPRKVTVTADNDNNKFIEQHVFIIAQLLRTQSFGFPQEKLIQVQLLDCRLSKFTLELKYLLKIVRYSCYNIVSKLIHKTITIFSYLSEGTDDNITPSQTNFSL